MTLSKKLNALGHSVAIKLNTTNMMKSCPDFDAVTSHLQIVESRLAELGDSACRRAEQRTSPIAFLQIATLHPSDAQPQPFDCVKASDLIENGDVQTQPFSYFSMLQGFRPHREQRCSTSTIQLREGFRPHRER